ncbi:lanthionine synthetase LanC family protein [Kribbella sp. NPDC026611]|uniref:lanthionine synthetase LanC family protein n=1 Tax=Kribbella sp. NPDC026611 TaxID=3154911 RepID=UPI0033C67132
MTTTASTETELTPTEAGDLAAEIADALNHQALWYEDRCLWLGDDVEPTAAEPRLIHHDTGAALYGGTAGIGWFLAHAAHHTNNPTTERTARAALHHALTWAENTGSPGLFTGVAGIGWAAYDAARVLDDTGLAKRALVVLRGALAGRQELSNELIAGRSGLVVAALSTQDDELLESAVRLGEQLLVDEEPAGNEPRWCGLGHGRSGPLLACADLARLTGDQRYVDAMLEQWRAERAWFGTAGWPDLREFDRAALSSGVRPTYPDMWCHGSIGIGLARLAAWKSTGQPGLLADATAALHHAELATAALLQSVPGGYAANFSLCHGAAGLIELFIVAANTLNDPSWLSAAAAVVSTGRVHQELGHAWRCGVEPGAEVPGLMLGLAGTGAALLRLAQAMDERPTMPSPLVLGADDRRTLDA